MEIGFLENFKLCVTKKYVNFSGRASKQEFWYFIAMYILIGIFIRILEVTILSRLPNLLRIYMIGIIIIFQLFLFVPYLSVLVRRVHDNNKSAWILLLPVLFLASSIIFIFVSEKGVRFTIPLLIGYLISVIYVFYLLVKKGTVGPNRYGEDPYLDENLEI